MPGERRRNLIEKHDAPGGVGCQHGIADTAQRGIEPLLLLQHCRRRSIRLAHLAGQQSAENPPSRSSRQNSPPKPSNVAAAIEVAITNAKVAERVLAFISATRLARK